MPATFAPEPPFSRPLLLRDVPEEGLRETITATPAECEAAAQELGLPLLASLEGRYRIQRAGSAGLHVRGKLKAVLTQVCVVTLDPFESTLEEDVDIAFAPPAPGSRRPADPDGEAIDLSQPDDPDPLIDGQIDLGRITLEFLVLALDPYPRKPGASFEGMPGVPLEEPSPFEVLSGLQGRSGGKDGKR